jgi:L-asparaginase II
MQPRNHVPLVEVTRGSIVESVHYGSLAIAQPDGNVIFSLGDMSSPFYLRSSAKPFQTLAFLETGGVQEYDLTLQEIAIICASHSGTDEHVQVLDALQAKIGIQESMLQCGIHTPYDPETAREKMMKGEAFHPNQHDCSGKHSGMLAFAKMIGAPMDNYLDPQHPVQQAMLRTFAEMCGVDIDTIKLGTDGCSAPVFAVPLPNSAAAYARLSQPDALGEPRATACDKITTAMMAHPFMVGGPERFDTDMMSAAGGSLVTKIGAEGFHGIGVMPGHSGLFPSGLGISIKIADGDLSLRAGCVVALQVLKQLKVLCSEEIRDLADYDRRPVYNWRGMEIGEIRPSLELLQALENLPA